MKTKTMKLIGESMLEEAKTTISNDNNKPFTMTYEGIFCESSRKNSNGRIYPYELLKREVERFDKEMI